MIAGGTGGGNTRSGLVFESKTSLDNAISQVEGLSLNNDKIYFNGEPVAELFGKNRLYKYLLEPKGIDYRRILSKKLLPDDAILNYKNNTLYIVEKKFQNCAGSVDEKLQTCDFKRKQYLKLFASTDIKVEYLYVLNDWFRDPGYKDVLAYIKESGCHYYFNTIPLKEIGF